VMFFSKDLTGTHKNELAKGYEDKMMKDINVTVTNDTIPYAKESIRIQKKTNDQDIKISMENGEVTELEIDGKKIDKSDYDKYQDIIQESKPSGMTKGSSRMFILGEDGDQSFQFNFGDEIFGDSIFKSFDFKDLGSFNFNQGQLQEQLKKLQEQLGAIQFNFQGLDSMHFAFPELDNMKDDPRLRMFELRDGDIFEAPLGEYPNGMPDFDSSRPNSSFSDAIGNALNKDGLLIPGQENKVELTGKYLKINGEKQPTNIYQKYRRIFEEESGTTLQKNSKLQFSFEGKESKRKYRVY